jgi:hypothetical protein
MHHLHISGFALFLIFFFVVALTAIVLGFISSSREAKRQAEIEMERVKRGDRSSAGGYSFGSGGNNARSYSAGGAGSVGAAPVASAPVYAAAPMSPGYSGSDLALGMMVGSAMSHHDTVIVDRGGYAPAYVEPAYVAPVDTGISFDSGPSDFGGGGGGIDISFGGGD